MTAHFVYVLRGWLTFRFAGVEGDVTRATRATACRSRPASPHNVIARSDDLEVIEINVPAEYGTWDLAAPEPPRSRGDSALAAPLRSARVPRSARG